MSGEITRLGDDGEEFIGGYPTAAAVQKYYDEADLNRAVQSYRLFFPAVSGLAILKGNQAVGIVPNRVFGVLKTEPKHAGLTLNSDTPYAPLFLDLHEGPMVIELPAGALVSVAMDLTQRWIIDMGLPGPDAGAGGKHLILPPGYEGDIPDGYQVGRSSTYLVLGALRAIPLGGDVEAAVALIKTVSVHPLHPRDDVAPPIWLDLTPDPQDSTPDGWEDDLGFWSALHEIVDTEPAFEGFRSAYGELAALGIAKGEPFIPDARMTDILLRAAHDGAAQLRVQSFADRRPDRAVWPDRQWEWAALRFENGDFDTLDAVDTEARAKWYYQAIGSSPAMFRRDEKAGSLYWLGLRSSDGVYLSGENHYTLTVPLPVPGKLFWSVTVYDARSRSQIDTPQAKAVISSLFDDVGQGRSSIEVLFGPTAPEASDALWIQTIPGAGWFTYFRIYGPEPAAFEGTWRPGDFEKQ